MGTQHTPGLCGCRLEPVNDDWQLCDLCSEASGGPAGIGWKIIHCPEHAAAPRLVTAITKIEHDTREVLAGREPLTMKLCHAIYSCATSAIAKATETP